MRVVFLGTANFAVPVLRACLAHHQVVAVVTAPERPGDRGRPAPRPVAEEARRSGLTLVQPARIRDPETVQSLLALQADALVVAAYGQILPAPLLEAPRFGAINVHASLLPRWRGASPVAHAILAGDNETGVSIMKMDRGLDTGPVYAQRHIVIETDATTPALNAKLSEIGAELLTEVLTNIAGGRAVARPQDDSAATHAPRLTRQDGELDWMVADADQVDRMVRALEPWPGVVAALAGSRVRILSGRAVRTPSDHTSGSVIGSDGESLLVAAREGVYRVDRVHPPGSKPMTAAAFARGLRGPAVPTSRAPQ